VWKAHIFLEITELHAAKVTCVGLCVYVYAHTHPHTGLNNSPVGSSARNEKSRPTGENKSLNLGMSVKCNPNSVFLFPYISGTAILDSELMFCLDVKALNV
jgi:hypothetical protein